MLLPASMSVFDLIILMITMEQGMTYCSISKFFTVPLWVLLLFLERLSNNLESLYALLLGLVRNSRCNGCPSFIFIHAYRKLGQCRL
jgi:hypothetical protein